MAQIKWEDVYDISNYPADKRDDLVAALERIENTQAGQQIFSEVRKKFEDPNHLGGSLADYKVVIEVGEPTSYRQNNHFSPIDPDLKAPTLTINLEELDKMAYFSPETQQLVKPTLAEIVFHETVHASDYTHGGVKMTNKETGEVIDLKALQEDYAIDLTNVFRNQADLGPSRGAHNLGVIDPQLAGLPPGVVNNFSAPAEIVQQWNNAQQEYEAKYGPINNASTIKPEQLTLDENFFIVNTNSTQSMLPEHVMDAIEGLDLSGIDDITFDHTLDTELLAIETQSLPSIDNGKSQQNGIC